MKITRTLVTQLSVCIAVLVVLVLYRMSTARRHRKYVAADRAAKQKQCRRIAPEETIFVSIASYRDPECHQTVFDCLEKAACPLRIHIGVCQQNYAVDVDVLEGYQRLAKKRGTGNYRDQIRVINLDAGQARGPMYARALIEQQLYNQEKYYMIVDSHMLFTHDWDVRVINMLQQCPSPKAVLTMYPDDFAARGSMAKRRKPGPPAFLRFKQFNKRTGLPEIEGPVAKKIPARPLPSLFWGACFSFASADMLREVPYDPYCYYVFMGEEISMAARLYTHGWDLYMPTDMVVRHMWTRVRPTFWEQFTGTGTVHAKRQQLEDQGYRRLRNLFGLQALQEGDLPLAPYGLGTTRTLADYQLHCGINFLLEKVAPYARSGITALASSEERLVKLGKLA